MGVATLVCLKLLVLLPLRIFNRRELQDYKIGRNLSRLRDALRAEIQSNPGRTDLNLHLIVVRVCSAVAMVTWCLSVSVLIVVIFSETLAPMMRELAWVDAPARELLIELLEHLKTDDSHLPPA